MTHNACENTCLANAKIFFDSKIKKESKKKEFENKKGLKAKKKKLKTAKTFFKADI